jgi:outer membrane scaffolding protein for murein synthesis (MipA/OmpV family)
LFIPKYKGSDEHRVAAYPLFDAQWKNGAFFSAFNGLGYNFSKNASLQYGLRMSLEAARDESRSGKLRGLGDVSTALEPGAFLNYSFNPNYSLVSSLRYGSGVDHNGLQVSLGAVQQPRSTKITGSQPASVRTGRIVIMRNPISA